MTLAPHASDPDPDTILFGAFRLVPSRRLLTRNGASIPLGARALDILIHLATRAGMVVDQDALVRAAWPGRAVEHNNLTVQISALRRALADGDAGQPIILTVPGRGYVFVAATQTTAVPPSTDLPSTQPTPTEPRRLPLAASAFIGRHAETAEIIQRLEQHRLVTVTGTGGIGKTRVALHLAHVLSTDYPGGVWFVDLSVLTSPDLVAEAVTTALAIGSGERPAAQRLVAFLAHRRSLLVLDNCEHVVDAVAALVAILLQGCPNISILATSRESLFVAEESTVRLPPLPFPVETDGIDAATALRHDAVTLFVERATATIPDFVLDDAAAPWVARICAGLDGIALAIEMAVPRLKVLTPQQLAERLAERLDLPANPSRVAVPRHRTLHAMIDWSYDLLSDGERALLRRLSLFAGGADLAAVLAVAAAADASEWDVLDRLGSLTEKSLLIADTSGPRRRFRLLETIRQYAHEKLIEHGETDGPRRHADHFALLFEAAEAQWPTTPTNAWLAQYGDDIDNLRAALEWAFGPDGDVALGVRLVAASYPLWWDLPQMPVPEGRRWFERATPLVTERTPIATAARLWLGASWRDMRYNDRDSLPAAQRAVALFRLAGEPVGLGAALLREGATRFAGDGADDTLALCTEAEQILRPLGPSKWLVMNLVRRADISMFARQLDVALPRYEEAMQMAEMLDHWYGRLVCTTNMAELLFDLGQRDRALDLLQGLRIQLTQRHRPPLLAPLVSHLLLAGNTRAMLDTARETVTLTRIIGLAAALGWVIEALALFLAEGDDPEAAARFAGFARRVHPAATARVGARRAVLVRLEAALDAAMPAAQRAALMAEGAAWRDDHAAERAMVVCAAQ